MRTRVLWVGMATALSALGANPFQPVISPNGVVNAASYLSTGFTNYGIARGSVFVIFGSALGPVDLVQASFPLPSSDGLAGTRVLISIDGYNAACPLLYSSINQVAAIMPSNAPEGDGTVVVSYQNQASTSAPIHVVRSAFGIFTRNVAGTGPAIAQNFVSQTSQPLNSLITSATPGQTVILWGTGLGPVNGDETGGPLPGALPHLDNLYVGSVKANVRYSGRSGCCAGVDEVIFDVPAGVAGCYVPVAAVTGGVVSNFGTISVNSSGKECDDPLTFRATELIAAERGGVMRSGRVTLAGSTTPGDVTFSGAFYSAGLDTVLAGTNRLKPAFGTCYLAVTRVGDVQGPVGQGLNAGTSVVVNGPVGLLEAQNVSSGGYSMTKPAAVLSPGSYGFTSTGGSDVGPWSANVNVAAPAVWSNAGSYNLPTFSLGSPLTFTWSGGDPNGLVTIRVATANATYDSSVECSVAPSAGSFTIPAFLTGAMYRSPVTVSFTSSAPIGSFSTTGLDAGGISISSTTTAQTIFQSAVQ